MSTPLYPYAPPDGVEVLIKWLSPLGEVRDERPNNAVLPYRMVHRLGDGKSDTVSDNGQYSVHTFALTKVEAQAESMITHRRICLLGGQFQGQSPVTMDDGSVVYSDGVTIDEFPHEVQWVPDNSIYRFVATYTIPFRYQAVT